MCMYFFAHAFVCDAFMFRLAPTIHCILTSILYLDSDSYKNLHYAPRPLDTVQGVVTLIRPVEPSMTEIKMESSDQEVIKS